LGLCPPVSPLGSSVSGGSRLLCVEVAMQQSSVVFVQDVKLDERYLTVTCSDGCVRRKKSYQTLDYYKIELARISFYPVRFFTRGSWSTDRWFAEFEVVEPETPVVWFNESEITEFEEKLFNQAISYALRQLRIDNPDLYVRIHTADREEGNPRLGWHRAEEEDGSHTIEVLFNRDEDGDIELGTAIYTLFHELRHAAQNIHNVLSTEIVEVAGERVCIKTWKDKPYRTDEIDYEDMPWEHDANKAAKIMVNRFTDRLKSA